jgi:hypothetical protein
MVAASPLIEVILDAPESEASPPSLAREVAPA